MKGLGGLDARAAGALGSALLFCNLPMTNPQFNALPNPPA